MIPDPKDAAQSLLDACGIEPGQIWKHYKGGLYSIIATAIDENTLMPLVVYRSNARGTVWVRTLANWQELADTETEYTLPDGSTRMGRARFVRVKH